MDVDPDSSHVLLTQDSLVCGPLESSDDGILDLVQVLHSLGDVHHSVRSGLVRSETPDFTCVVNVPGSEFVIFFCELLANNPGEE